MKAWCILSILICVGVRVSVAQPVEWQPEICTGWVPAVKSFGMVGAESPLAVNECPPGQVLLSERAIAGHPSTPRLLAVTGACCSYPPDALTSETRRANVKCPPDFVVTGATHPAGGAPDLICTKINTDRYRLGPPRPAVHITERGGEEGPWNSVLSLFDRGFEGRAYSWAAVPPALRYGLARFAVDRWDYELCTGHPWGSALTGKTLGKGCSFEHRELLLKAEKRSAEVFPRCLAVEGVVSAKPVCVR